MSGKAMSWSRTVKVGSSSAKQVLRELCISQNELTGQCTLSINSLIKITELSETTVLKALAILKARGFIHVEKVKTKNGWGNSYSFPLMESTYKNEGTPNSRDTPKIEGSPSFEGKGTPNSRDTGTPKTRDLKKEEKREKKNPKTSFSIPRPEDVPEQLWADFVTHRKAKKAPITETVIKRTRSEAAKCSMTLSQAIEMMVARGWQGFEARFVLDNRPKNQFCPDYRESTPAPNPAHNPFIPRRAKTPEELQAEKEQREAEELFGGLFR